MNIAGVRNGIGGFRPASSAQSPHIFPYIMAIPKVLFFTLMEGRFVNKEWHAYALLGAMLFYRLKSIDL